MALDRQSIEKKDFPVGRRGYDPEAVDTHLAALADEIAEYKRSARRRTDTLASSASEQVRAIVEAAETSAAEIQREAEEEARDIREEAANEARATRDQATEQARDYVGQVSESTNTMLGRLDSMEQELNALIESLRTGGNRLNADLQLLEADLAGAGEVVSPRPRFEPEAEAAAAAAAGGADAAGSGWADAGGSAEPEIGAVAEGTDDAGLMGGGQGPEGEGELSDAGELSGAGEPAPEAAEFEQVTGDGDLNGAPVETVEPGYEFGEGSVAGEGDRDDSDDAEGARLIALNMALNGTPREETARYLSENFRLSDAGGLLDEVYASVEG